MPFTRYLIHNSLYICEQSELLIYNRHSFFSGVSQKRSRSGSNKGNVLASGYKNLIGQWQQCVVFPFGEKLFKMRVR